MQPRKPRKKSRAQLDREIAEALAARPRGNRARASHAAKKKPQTYFPVEGTRSYPYERAAFDLCRIDTTRLRSLSPAQLDKASQRLGRSFMLPKKAKTRYLVSSFISNLKTAKQTPTTERDVYYEEWGRYPDDFRARREAEGKGYSDEQLAKDVEHSRRVKAMYESMADEKEREIWQAQAKAGCPVKDVELVARDLELQGESERARQLRQEARRPSTPRKGRKPTIR